MNVRHHILVVDDEPLIADAVVRLLQSAPDLSAEVYRAYRGQEALHILGSTRVDLLLSDIRMPDMSGLDLLDAVNRQWPACRTIFLTGYPEFSYAYEAFSKRAAGYILKSETDEKVLFEVRRVLSGIEASLRQPPLSEAGEPDARPLPSARLAQADALARWGFPEPLRVLYLVLGLVRPAPGAEDERQLRAIFSRYLGDTLLRMAPVSYPGDGPEGGLLWLCQMAASPSGVWFSGQLEIIQSAFSTTTGREVSFLISGEEKGCGGLPAALARLIRQGRARFPAPGEPPFIYITPLSGVERTATDLIPFLEGYVESHIHEDISVSHLSAATGYNGDYLSRLYRQATGKSLGRFIADCKLTLIRRLLRDPERSLDVISRQSGFSSRSYFNRFIKRESGLTPQQLQALELSSIPEEEGTPPDS